MADEKDEKMGEENYKILVVEDEPEVAAMFGIILEMYGYQVVKVYGTGAAISAVEREKPDAVLLDVMLPDISGLELCRYIRREPRYAGLPIIVVSARVRPEDVAEGLEAGATAYLNKPVSKEVLIETLSKALAES